MPDLVILKHLLCFCFILGSRIVDWGQLGVVAHANTLSVRRLRQEDCHKFETSLSYIMSSRLTWTTV